MDKLKAFLEAAEREVANHSIYVWASSGKMCKDINEKWIRSKEARCENGKYADDAVAAWKAVMDSEYADVARAFDCSGFVSYCLIQAKALDKRRDCDGLFSKCEPTDKLTDGTLLFRVNKDNPNDETHVGIYINGLQYHAKGRCFGVVKETYAPRYWAKAAWFKALPHEVEPVPQPEPEPKQYYVKVLGGSVRVRNCDSILGGTIGIVHNAAYKIKHQIGTEADRLPLIGPAPSGWYIVEFKGQTAYITNKPKYTEVVYE